MLISSLALERVLRIGAYELSVHRLVQKQALVAESSAFRGVDSSVCCFKKCWEH